MAALRALGQPLVSSTVAAFALARPACRLLQTSAALRDAHRGERHWQALCQVEGVDVPAGTSAREAFQSAWNAYYGIELSVLPGGMRRYDFMVLSTLEEVRRCLALEFTPEGSPAYAVESLMELICHGLAVRLFMVSNGAVRYSTNLQDRMRFVFRDGTQISVESVRGEEGSHEPRGDARAPDAELTAPHEERYPNSYRYRVFTSGPRDYAQVTDRLQHASEMADEALACKAMSDFGYILSVNLDGIPRLPLTAWPARPPSTALVYEGEEVEYGDNDLEGIRDSIGPDFWTSKYELQ